MTGFLTGFTAGVLGTAITWGIVNKIGRAREKKKVQMVLDKVEELKLENQTKSQVEPVESLIS
jgi:hypothetical protein